MPNDYFAFKKFRINQDKCAMKVGTDSVLLGAWVNAEGCKNILDIGMGTGIIALMLAQKSNALIDAIDIDDMACEQATENVVNSPWKERITILHTSFQEFAYDTNKHYELIVSNPPYFVDSSKARLMERTIARHTDLLPYEELLEGVLKLLTRDGKFCVILPLKEGLFFRDIAELNGLFLTKLVRVKSREDKPEKRLMMQFEFSRKCFSESFITIEKDERHSYSDEYKDLTKDYYLNF